MLDTSARLLRLLFVLQSRRFWSGAELSARLEVTDRTLRRDIDRLRSLGYVIDAVSGPGGGYQLGKGTAMPPVALEDDEAVAITVALRSAADAFVTLGDTSLRLLAKLDQIFPARLRRRVSALHAMTISVGRSRPTVDPERLTTLAAACRDGAALRIGYLDRQARPSHREVEPSRLAHTGARWYLLAWDRGRTDWRTFRVDRIESLRELGETFTPREPPANVEAFVTDALRTPYHFRATARLRGSLDTLARTVPAWVGRLESAGRRHCTLHVAADTLDGLAAMLLLSGAEIEAVEPAELIAPLRGIVQRLAPGLGVELGPVE